MEIIRSVHNPLVKEIKKLQHKKYREEKGEFLVEGVRLVEEGLESGRIRGILYDETLLNSERGKQLLHKIEQMTEQKAKQKGIAFIFRVVPQVIKSLAETQTPQGIVAVAAREPVTMLSLDRAKKEQLLLVIDGLQDPGNMGTLVRTAWCAGAAAVVCLPGTTDPFGGKAVRSTMGGIFRIPVITGVEWDYLRDWCRENEYGLVAGDLSAEDTYYSVAYPHKTALIIGNEGQGLLNVDPAQLDYRVRIPLKNGAESLNAAVAGGILLYEIIRQWVRQ